MTPTTPATTPTASRSAGSLTPRASTSGPLASARASTSSDPTSPPAAATPPIARRDRSSRGTASAARSGLKAARSATNHSQAEPPSSDGTSPRPARASTMADVRRSAASACCWSSMRVTPSRNHAPWTRLGSLDRSASAASLWACMARPAMHIARSPTGPRRSARRGSASATRHRPVSASPTTP